MQVLRTPESRFESLPDFPYEPRYEEVSASDTDGIRMAYIDEGPPDASPIVLLHGEPTWGFLYRRMIPSLVADGHRTLVPDLIGFGRSDKPREQSDHTYLRHVEWVTAWIEALDLREITLFVQDWGSLIGLRIAVEQSHRVSRVMVANGFLPTADREPGFAFKSWRTFARFTPVFPCGRIVATGSVQKLSKAERAAYDAPFPQAAYQAGPRAMPTLVPTSPGDPAVSANLAAWARLGTWDKPFLCVFGKDDPILGGADKPLIDHVPGAAGQPHGRIEGGHFIQEDAGAELAARLIEWIG